METKQKDRRSDLTEGAPAGKILLFALSIIAGLLFQRFYGIVDTAIDGHFLGMEALAGVGATTSICDLFIGFGCGSGFGIPAARHFGAGDIPGIRRIPANSLYLTLSLLVGIAAVTTVFSNSILTFMNARKC